MTPSKKKHLYPVEVVWTGNRGQGTQTYRAYERSHEIKIPGKPTLLGSADPTFRGDRTRYNPEELLVASLSSCHLLWYLHLCADAQIVVTHYIDSPVGVMVETTDGGGRFAEVTLNPVVTLMAGQDSDLAEHLHKQAHERCFIANSVNFPVHCQPTTQQ